MNIRIFTIHHQVPQSYIATEVFRPFITGVQLGAHPHLMADDNGDNIGRKGGFAEMRAHYYVWKNQSAGLDMVGFQHYRRAFLFQFMAEPRAASDIASTSAALLKHRELTYGTANGAGFLRYLEWLGSWDPGKVTLFKEFLAHFDIVVPRAMAFGIPLGQQYGVRHIGEHWPKFAEAIRRHPRFAVPYLDLDLLRLVPCNMFIMRGSLFHEYMTIWHEIMADLETSITVPDDPYQNRVFGFLSERVFTIYLHMLQIEQPTLRVLELPYLYQETA